MMQYFDLEQGSDSWFDCRRGIATASRFDRIITPTGKPSAQSRKLICELIGERYSLILPERVETYTNRAMRYGQETEEEARRFFRLETGLPTSNGGFCLSDDGRFGTSPDALVGEDAVLEIKCPLPATHVEYLLNNELPAEYRPQCHGHLIVTGRPLCWFLSYSAGFQPLLVKVEPDEYTEKLRAALDEFWDRYTDALQNIVPSEPKGVSA